MTWMDEELYADLRPLLLALPLALLLTWMDALLSADLRAKK
jgi:hypothetical protein